jgi:hypothetical protein
VRVQLTLTLLEASDIVFVWLLFQAPYLIYVEIVECDDANISPVPSKMMDSTVLRRIHSQEDVMASSSVSSETSPAERCSPKIELTSVDTGPVYMIGCEFDDPDCWSQEEDDIIQVHMLCYLFRF